MTEQTSTSPAQVSAPVSNTGNRPDSNKPLQVAATQIFGPFDSAPRGGGTLTLIDQTITYTPESSKVERVRLAVNDIVRINIHKTRLELYTRDGKRCKFFVTVPHGMGYVNTSVDNPVSAVFAVVDVINNIDASKEYIKDSRKVADTWQPWLERIMITNPNITIEHKNRTWHGPALLAGIILLCIVALGAIVVLTRPS
ncbi:MAG: hypothetical protein WBP26_02120 [Candidatus Saccharimonadales bacterium]